MNGSSTVSRESCKTLQCALCWTQLPENIPGTWLGTPTIIMISMWNWIFRNVSTEVFSYIYNTLPEKHSQSIRKVENESHERFRKSVTKSIMNVIQATTDNFSPLVFIVFVVLSSLSSRKKIFNLSKTWNILLCLYLAWFTILLCRCYCHKHQIFFKDNWLAVHARAPLVARYRRDSTQLDQVDFIALSLSSITDNVVKWFIIFCWDWVSHVISDESWKILRFFSLSANCRFK